MKEQTKGTIIEGDIAVERNVTIGGNTLVQGDSHLKGNVKIDGWLETDNVTGTVKGLFLTDDKLKSKYPNPQDGWIAFVGNTLPASVYIANGGKWQPTGETGGSPTVDIAHLDEAISELSRDIVAIEDVNSEQDEDIAANASAITKIKAKDDEQDTRLTAIEGVTAMQGLQIADNTKVSTSLFEQLYGTTKEDLKTQSNTHQGFYWNGTKEVAGVHNNYVGPIIVNPGDVILARGETANANRLIFAYADGFINRNYYKSEANAQNDVFLVKYSGEIYVNGTSDIPAEVYRLNAESVFGEINKVLTEKPYTNISAEFGEKHNEQTLFQAATILASARRLKYGNIFASKFKQYSKFKVTVTKGADYDGKLAVIIDGNYKEIRVAKGDTPAAIAKKISQVTTQDYIIKHYDEFQPTVVHFNRVYGGKGSLRIENNIDEIQYYSKEFTIPAIKSQNPYDITISYGDNKTIQINCNSNDTVDSIINKIVAAQKTDLGVMRIAADRIVLTYLSVNATYDIEMNTSATGYDKDSFFVGQIINFAGLPDVHWTIDTISEGGDAKLKTYQQRVISDDDNIDIGEAEDNFNVMATADDVNAAIAKHKYSTIVKSKDVANIPSELVEKGLLRTKEHPYFGQDLSIFTARENNDVTNEHNWSNINFHFNKLYFSSGVAEITPMQDDYGNYVYGYDWQLKVIKPLKAQRIGIPETADVGQITIPNGIYTFHINVLDNPRMILWWNSKTNSVEYGTPSSYTYCNVIACFGAFNPNRMIFAENYDMGIVYMSAYNNGTKTVYQIKPGVTDTINVTNLLPDNFSGIDVGVWFKDCLLNIPNWYFPVGEYKTENYFWKSYHGLNGHSHINIIGDGKDKTIFRNWNFAKKEDCLETTSTHCFGVNYKGCTLKNFCFANNGSDVIFTNKSTTFENVKILTTLEAPYFMNIHNAALSEYKLYIKNCDIVTTVPRQTAIDSNMGAIAALIPMRIVVEDSVIDNFYYAIMSSGKVDISIKGCDISVGYMGVMADNAFDNDIIVENCKIKGNGVYVFTSEKYYYEISAKSIRQSAADELKIYYDARNGTEGIYTVVPTIDFANIHTLHFCELSGTKAKGKSYPIVSTGTDSSGKYIAIKTALKPNDIKLSPNKNPSATEDSNYQVMVVNCDMPRVILRNNRITDASEAGFYTCHSSDKCIIEGNVINAGTCGIYMPNVNYNQYGHRNNVIKNNTITLSRADGTLFYKEEANTYNYNNIVVGNAFNDNLGIWLENERNLVYENNILTNEDSVYLDGSILASVTTSEPLNLKPATTNEEFFSQVPSYKRGKGVRVYGLINNQKYSLKYIGADVDDTSWNKIANWQPCRSPRTAEFEDAGARYNDATGYYKVNDLTDIDEDEMTEIYEVSAGKTISTLELNNTKIRTNLRFVATQTSFNPDRTQSIRRFETNAVEVLDIRSIYNSLVVISENNGGLARSTSLKKIIGTIDYVSSTTKNDVFIAANLEEVNIKFRNSNNTIFNLSNVKKLKYISWYHMANNSQVQQKATLEIMVASNIYALMNGKATDEEYTATGHTVDEWTEIPKIASEKNIVFTTKA